MKLKDFGTYLFYILCGFLFGLLLDLMISFNVWLEMRIHSEHIIYISIAVFLGFGIWHRKNIYNLFYILETLILFIAYKSQKIEWILYTIKEFLQQDLVQIDKIKIPVVLIFVITNVFITYLATRP